MNAARAANALIVLIGMAVLAYGLAMTVSTPWGVSPWDVFHLGVAGRTALSLGQVAQITGVVLILAAWLIRRKHVTLVSLVNAVLVGLLIDFFRERGYVPYVDGWWGLIYLECGIVVFAAGMAMYLAPRMGAGPRDALMMSLADVLKLPPGRIRVAMDLAALGAGAALGGPLGVGTLIAALTLGPWVQLMMEPATKLCERVSSLGQRGSDGSTPIPANRSARRRQ